MPYHLEETYWNGGGTYQEAMNTYFEELVPSFGEAQTVEGEILRAINQLIHDHYNNGSCNARADHSSTLVAHNNLFDSQTREQIKLIDKMITELDQNDVFYYEDIFSESSAREYERALEGVMDAVIEFVASSDAVDVDDVNI